LGGSGANSIIAYCLELLIFVPELDLYFERFLNENRKSPPDFDIDWSWQERDVILEYIFLIVMGTKMWLLWYECRIQNRSIFREVGKVFGLPKKN
jgi:DNA polymerase-3 subunit alpha/error-prone DNA polymerase